MYKHYSCIKYEISKVLDEINNRRSDGIDEEIVSIVEYANSFGIFTKTPDMIKEMSPEDELRTKIAWREADIEHLVVERDRATAALDSIGDIVNEYFGPTEKWTHPMDGRSVITRIRKILNGA